MSYNICNSDYLEISDLEFFNVKIIFSINNIIMIQRLIKKTLFYILSSTYIFCRNYLSWIIIYIKIMVWDLFHKIWNSGRWWYNFYHEKF